VTCKIQHKGYKGIAFFEFRELSDVEMVGAVETALCR